MRKVFEIQSHSQNLKTIREEIRRLLKESGFSDKITESVLVALGEACTNAMRHAYLNETHHPIHITYEDHPDRIVLRIRDFGKKIELDKIQTPELPPKKGGGLGIYFMKTMMDELQYNTSHEQGNELILTKYKNEGEHRADSH